MESGRDWGEVAQLRQALYRFFGGSFLPPDESRLEAMLAAADVLEDAGIDDFAFAVPWRAFTAAFDELPSLDDLEAHYIRSFLGGAAGGICPPVEAEYTTSAGPSAAVVPIELEREYRDMGLAVAPGSVSGADHCATELEAMASLCHREAHAWEEDGLSEAISVLRTEWGFLHRHLARWFPLFAKRLRVAEGQGFYVALVDAADAFVQHDHELVASLAGTRTRGTR